MRLKQALTAAALGACVAAASSPAAAQSSASAFMGNLSYELIDLTPDDGSAPYITFTGSTTSFATSSLYADPNFGQLAATSTVTGDDLGSTFVSNADGTASASASPFAVTADARLLGNSGLAQSFSIQDFVLSANTRVIFTVFGSVEATPDSFNGGSAFAFAGVSGELLNDTSDGRVSFGSSMSSRLLREERYLVAVAQTLGLETPGWVGLQSGAEAATLAAPVPEPGPATMLVAGLAMLAGVARRRAARG